MLSPLSRRSGWAYHSLIRPAVSACCARPAPFLPDEKAKSEFSEDPQHGGDPLVHAGGGCSDCWMICLKTGMAMKAIRNCNCILETAAINRQRIVLPMGNCTPRMGNAGAISSLDYRSLQQARTQDRGDPPLGKRTRRRGVMRNAGSGLRGYVNQSPIRSLNALIPETGHRQDLRPAP
jgi:hypothetical protein